MTNQKIIMEGTIDCIMHDNAYKVTPSNQTKNIDFKDWPKDADIPYSKLWIVLNGSDPENPHWLEIKRPMIPECEWMGIEKEDLVRSGKKIRVTMEIIVEREESQ